MLGLDGGYNDIWIDGDCFGRKQVCTWTWTLSHDLDTNYLILSLMSTCDGREPRLVICTCLLRLKGTDAKTGNGSQALISPACWQSTLVLSSTTFFI
jgi:hypothetical protein